jgi:biotin carboxyl carrier protein
VSAKLRVTLAEATGIREHDLAFDSATASAEGGQESGKVRCSLDGEDRGHADWVRIARGLYYILLNGRSYEARVSRAAGDADYDVRVGAEKFRVTLLDPRARRQASGGAVDAGPKVITAPMPGKIVKLLVREGEEVAAGAGVLVMEAMKMQNELRAPRAGRVERIHVSEGEGVETGAPLVRLV